TIAALILWLIWPVKIFSALFYGALILLLFSLFFFRDPQRQVTSRSNCLVSPADGKVIAIKENVSHPVTGEASCFLAIFLAITNVHVNRYPIAGKVKSVNYKKGRFLAAFNPDAGDLNEQYVINFESVYGMVQMRQIAGIIARRLVCNARVGDKVSVGEKFGLMKFSSRIDLYFPMSGKLQVEVGEKVRGGESVLAFFPEQYNED
ncbi:MAG TPA: phosphatidylserine decarboxylase, partial [Candidatus Marinimicrobia bacterium]|nr:phosphatidylserine decarboxylase [Candidatus Neomarinimicrobiota bacterium]